MVLKMHDTIDLHQMQHSTCTLNHDVFHYNNPAWMHRPLGVVSLRSTLRELQALSLCQPRRDVQSFHRLMSDTFLHDILHSNLQDVQQVHLLQYTSL